MDDEDAEAFCRATFARLAGALGLMCGERGVGEELAQEALLRAWERWSTVRQMDSPESWVFRVGFNLANSRLRRVIAERRANQRVSTRAAAVEWPSDGDAVAVRTAVLSLPPRQRAAVVLRYFADLSVDATAAALECAPGTVKSLTSQGIESLRGRLTIEEEHADV